MFSLPSRWSSNVTFCSERKCPRATVTRLVSIFIKRSPMLHNMWLKTTERTQKRKRIDTIQYYAEEREEMRWKRG